MQFNLRFAGLLAALFALPSAQAGVAHDAILAEKFAAMLQKVEQADADLPKMRGAHEIKIFESTSSAVVLIFSLDERGNPNGLGSGSVLNTNGQILTNMHVVEDADRVAVVFKPRSGSVDLGDIRRADLYTARVEKVDAVRDLALLQLERHHESLTALTLGSLNSLSIGADVHAIGHPEGATWSYTKGIVSQIRHNAEWSYSDGGGKHHATVIQTQTPINPGNSGGPLLNDTMQLVGVNTYGKSDAQGMNYAVSVDDVKRFIAEPGRQPGRKASADEPSEPKPGRRRPVHDEESGEHTGVNIIERVTDDRRQREPDGSGTGRRSDEDRGDGCKPRYNKRERDKGNPAWRTEGDYDCSGRINSYLLEWDDAARGQALYLDRNGDGRMDAVYHDRNHDGRPEQADFDTQHSGRFDLRLRFDEQNGQVVQSMRLGK